MSVSSINDIYFILDRDLRRVDSLISESLSCHDEAIQSIGNYIIGSGGKRIRPMFNLIFSRIFNYSGSDNISISAAVEFFHTATLLHDDVIDDSKLRRGKESVHKKWGNKYAILTGDFLFSKAFKLMISTKSVEVLDVLSHAATVISEGEVKQLKNLNNVHLSKDEYIEILKAKTAELFAVASKTAAIISSQSENMQRLAYDFGINFGIAFQIIDDVLDYTSNSSGKDIGKDFYEAKVTLPVILLLELCSVDERVVVEQLFSANSRNSEELASVKNLMEKYHIFSLSNSFILSYLLVAKQIYDSYFKKIDSENLLKQLLEEYIGKFGIVSARQ